MASLCRFRRCRWYTAVGVTEGFLGAVYLKYAIKIIRNTAERERSAEASHSALSNSALALRKASSFRFSTGGKPAGITVRVLKGQTGGSPPFIRASIFRIISSGTSVDTTM